MSAHVVDVLSNPLSSYLLPCFIAGKARASSQTYPRLDPHTGRHLFDVSAADESIVQEAIKSAQAAFAAWSATSSVERRRIFQSAAKIIEERKEQIVKLGLHETTNSEPWANIDIILTIAALDELAEAITQLKAEVVQPAPGQEGYIFRVVLGIAPWNAALTLACRAISNPIMAGNTAILKTSEHSPRLHMAVAQIFAEAGLPDGVLNAVHVDPGQAPKITEMMIAHPAIRKVNFTGSTLVGSKIAEVCGRHLKPVVMELGGAAPFIVLEDADVEHAVNNAVHGSFLHSGQICMSTNTLLLHGSIADEFISTMKQYNLSASAASSSPYRGLFTSQSADRVRGLIDEAVTQGPVISIPSSDNTLNSPAANVVQPTLLDKVPESAKIASEEIFGPAVGIVRFTDEAEAVRIANARDYGLSAAVFSKDIARAFRIARQIEAGAVHINGSTIHDYPTLPHGGWKKSGWGRFNGLEGIKEFTQTKVVTVNELHKYPMS
ncbi:hypothetical protein FRC09_001735 [Ceratobasidium sp. 395]|nr:hypothetical protein FRC09_001735 [Ceratobasidium sp. 395]